MKTKSVVYILILCLYALTLSISAKAAKNSEPLYSGKIYNEFHQSNIGKIVFVDKPIPGTQYRDQVLVNSVSLNTDKNLYVSGFLKKPLTNYLSEIAPELSVEDLNKKGNYQFTFYVDKKQVYQENLNFGAGLPHQKSNNTILTVPLFSEKNEDSWGRFLWMRFMHFGGEEALTEGRHELKIELRPYVKNPNLKVGSLIASGLITINVVKPVATEEQIAIQPIKKNSGWQISTDSFNKDKIRELNKRIAQQDFKEISSIVVIKDGQLLLEQYFNGSDRSSLHDPRSVGKSFASSVLGIAINEGHIKSEEQSISQFYDLESFENSSEEKASVTLKELLTMSSGFEGDDSDYSSLGNEEKMYPTNDWVKFALDLPMSESADNKVWSYFTAGTVLLGDILHKKVPGGLEKYAHEKLFAPLGIKSYQWQYTPQGVANTAGGLRLTALDFAKFGQLYKNQGSWKGKQLITKDWVKNSLSPQVARTGNFGGGHYGYLFWHDSIPINGKVQDVAYATGNGGNKIYVFKDLPFVVVILAKAYNKPYAHKQVLQMMGQYILPALQK